MGGAFIFVRRELSGRIRIILRSWRLAQRAVEEDPQAVQEQLEKNEEAEEPVVENQKVETKEKTKAKETQKEAQSLQVPTSFEGMFLFNAAVMGLSPQLRIKLLKLFNGIYMILYYVFVKFSMWPSAIESSPSQGYGESPWMKLVLDHLDAIAVTWPSND